MVKPMQLEAMKKLNYYLHRNRVHLFRCRVSSILCSTSTLYRSPAVPHTVVLADSAAALSFGSNEFGELGRDNPAKKTQRIGKMHFDTSAKDVAPGACAIVRAVAAGRNLLGPDHSWRGLRMRSWQLWRARYRL